MLFRQMRHLFVLATVEEVFEFSIQSKIIIIQLLYAPVGIEPLSLCFKTIFLITRRSLVIFRNQKLHRKRSKPRLRLTK
jgi:hypothetical protein